MKWFLLIIGILAFLLLVVLVIGYLLPVKHMASIRVSVNAAPDAVWKRITDIKEYPSWRKDLVSVQAISDTEWIEVDKDKQRLPMKIMALEPKRRMVSQINDRNLPFGGTWEFILEPRGNTTEVSITENGEVYNPIFRFVSKFIMGHTATLKKYAGYLQTSVK
jgi:hypothetical protein